MKSLNTIASCHIGPTISQEQFIAEHIFIHLVAGTMTVYDRNREYPLQSGDYCIASRNHLARYTKKPPENGPLKTSSIILDQDFLRNFSNSHTPQANNTENNHTIIHLKPTPLLSSFSTSLPTYLSLSDAEQEAFLPLKKKELMLILLKTNPELQNVLFNFSEPGKVDLESFMMQNFRFNVSLKRFSYLTGRSLTTFKRDFQHTFHQAPGRWLLEQRLQEAHYLIQTKGTKPSNVYLQVGFEDLSHFSYAFKKKYGISPNQLKQNTL